MNKSVSVFKRVKNNYFCYIWIAPFFITFIIFQLYPILYGFYLSLSTWDGFGGSPTFVGLMNYKNLFQDDLFWLTLKNTFTIWFLIVPLRTFLALVLATIVNSPRLKGGKLYSFFLLLPNMTAIVVVAIVFRIMLSTNGGILNVFLANTFNIEPIAWLESVSMSKISLATMNIWKATGYFMIVMLAGLQRIPISIYEAARIDGATGIQVFFRITIPSMKDVIYFVVMISTIWIFQNVGDSMVLTNGGPLYSSTPTILYMYKNAFEFFKLGYASAIAYSIFVLLFVINIISIRVQNRSEA